VPWRGYNFEDAILVSEKLVKDDYYTSIHIEEYESKRATPSSVRKKLLAIFRTSANRSFGNLDESGVIRIGAVVKPGDILVGKVTPKAKPR